VSRPRSKHRVTSRPAAPGAASHLASRRLSTAFVAILALAFGVRLAAVLWLRDTVPYSDYSYYQMAGEKIASDWGFFFDASQVEYYGKFGWWPPLYPFTIGALYTLFGVNHHIVVAFQVLLGTLVCGLVYRLGSRFGGERTGRIAALLVASSPSYVFATNLLASENLFVFWLVLGLLLLIRPEPRPRTLAGAGFLFGLGALTRASGLLVPIVAALWLRSRTPSPRAWLRAAAVLLGTGAATIAPWTVRNALVVGDPAIVCFGGGLNFYFGHNAESIGYRDLSRTPMAHLTTQAAIDRSGYRLGAAHIAAQPLGFLTRGMRKVVALFGIARYAEHDNSAIMLPEGWNTDPAAARVADALRARQRAKNHLLDGLFTWLAAAHGWFLLAGAVATALRWRDLGAEARLLVYLCLGWIGAHVLFWAQPRFRYPMDLFLLLLAALAVTRMWPVRAPAATERSRS